MKILHTIFICLFLGIAPALSAQHAPTVLTPRLLAQNKALDASEAAARVQRKLGGRILSVETIQRKGKLFHRIKILTRKGVVRVIRVNANTGRFK